jgi:hypothetical protein
MKYAVKMGSGAMIMHVPSFIKIVSGIQKLISWDTQAYKHHGDRISLLQESRLKITGKSRCGVDRVTSVHMHVYFFLLLSK